jgi:hypothetical protein
MLKKHLTEDTEFLNLVTDTVDVTLVTDESTPQATQKSLQKTLDISGKNP